MASLEARWIVKWSRYGRRFGVILATRDEGTAFGPTGARGYSWKLTVWRKPRG